MGLHPLIVCQTLRTAFVRARDAVSNDGSEEIAHLPFREVQVDAAPTRAVAALAVGPRRGWEFGACLVSILQSIVVNSARLLPLSLKRRLHHNRFLDRASRRLYGSLVCGPVIVESGPLAGLSLQAGPHISHAHIRGTYELGTQRAIAKTVQSGCVCYDVGASVGYLTLLMARKARHVFAFEPAQHAAAVLQEQVKANGFENRVTLVRIPVSDARKTVHFGLTDNTYGSRIVETGVEVEAITLDDFAAVHGVPDFIKMDIEGEELRALQGARKLLREHPTLCIEIHSAALAVAVNDLLTEYNYRIELIEESRLSPYVPGEARPGDVQVLCTHSSRT